MVNSLAWRIQLWHALIMLVVIAGLGTFLYLRIERSEFDRIDTELESTARQIVSTLRGLSQDEFVAGDFTLPPLVLGERRLLPPADRPPPPRRQGPPPPRRQGPPRAGDNLIYIVWDEQGAILQASELAPSIDFAEVPRLAGAGASVRPRRDYRDVFLPGPHGSTVLVSRSIRREMGDLHQWRWLLIGAGVIAIIVGVLGGAWLTRRALRPLKTMSEAAAAISAENLSGRIDTAAIDVELAGLARTLNATFDRLEADIQKKTRFAADASHELRTPLTIIQGYLEFALSQPPIDDATREALEASLRAARRMKSLIEQLLLLARADAGKLEPERQALDLSAVVEECVDLLTPLAKQKQVALHTDLPPGEVLGDPRLLSQAVINLITNAIQHNRTGGSVTITMKRQEGQWLLVIADTGPGIEPAAQPHIFERFYRADAARSRATGGAGLGLAISQSIVRAHGGELTFTSVLDRGTDFMMRLPATDNHAPTIAK